MKWISVKEKSPPDAEEIIAYCVNPRGVVIGYFYLQDKDLINKFIPTILGCYSSAWNEDVDWRKITHWMPLPPDPTFQASQD